MAEYRVGVIGHTGRGNYGHGVDTVWQSIPQCQVVAVADADPQGRAAAVDRLKAPRGFADYREMLDQVPLEIVAIGPRWLDQHLDMVLAAAERGKHIYMEKPMCRTLEEADAMVAACEKHHVKLALAHQTRYSPKLHLVRELIEDGKIGKVLELRGRGKEDRRGGSEDLWVLGSHVMNLIHYFGGEPSWCFARVTQGGKPIRKADLVEGAEGIGPLAGDAVTAMYGLDNDVTAYFSSQRNQGKKPRFGLQIMGSEGILEIVTGYLPAVMYLPDPMWSPGRTGAAWVPVSSAGIGKPEPLSDGGLGAGNIVAVQDLLAAIETDRQPECSVYEGRMTIEMIAAVFESHRQGRPVSVPLENRKNPLSLLES